MILRLRRCEQVVQFRMVLIDGALESGTDDEIARLIEGPPVRFEVQHCELTFRDHPHTLTAQGSSAQAPSPTTSPTVSAMGSRPFLIGVAGGTSSGKSTIAERLEEIVGPDQLSLIKLDAYYISRTHQPMEERAAANYDHPSAFDWNLLNQHLTTLLSGERIPVPVYDYAIHDRVEEVRWVEPTGVVVVEGILVLWEPDLRDRFDLKVFVDTPADLRFIRRLQRDVVERGRTQESIIAQYLATVRPSHEDFVEPSRAHADVIVPEGGLNRPAVDVLLARVRELTAG